MKELQPDKKKIGPSSSSWGTGCFTWPNPRGLSCVPIIFFISYHISCACYLHHKVIGGIVFTCVSLSVCLSVTPTLLSR